MIAIPRQCNCRDKCVPKCNLGTRNNAALVLANIDGGASIAVCKGGCRQGASHSEAATILRRRKMSAVAAALWAARVSPFARVCAARALRTAKRLQYYGVVR